MADENEVALLTKEFKRIDTDGSGAIDKSEITEFLLAKKVNLSAH